MKLSNYPVLKVLFPYLIGILLGYFCHLPAILNLIIPFLGLLFLLISMVINHFHLYKWQYVQSFTLQATFISLGMVLTNFYFTQPLNKRQQELLPKNSYWVVRVVDFPVERTKSVKTLVELQQSAKGEKMKGKVLLYFNKSPKSLRLKYGDVLLIASKLSEIEATKNPDAFDNQKYMHRKGIYYTGYVPNSGWQIITTNVPNPIKAFAHQIQKYLAGIFAHVGLSGEEYDIITAILLGDDDTMEPELKADYAAAGVSHILCVSGMHVGVIYMIINFLFKPLDLFKSTRAVKACILLLLIWFYAYITGLSPSVTRSAAMFTFVTFGSLMNRNTNIFHSLFASLFILLIINPLLLFDVGFELSYLAVFGIVIFQKPLVGIYTCKTRIGHYFWELMTVSVSAQISTFPISIYYFGQFPNYFLLSNLSVIALSFVVMISGIVLLALSFIRILVPILSRVLIMEIKLMNGIVHFIDKIPGSVTQNIDYSLTQMLMLYVVIAGTLLFFRYKKRLWGWAAYMALAIFSVNFMVKKIANVQDESVTVYHIRGACAVGISYHGQSLLFSDSIQDEQNTFYQYSIKNHARKHQLKYNIISMDTATYQSDYLCKYGHAMVYKDRRFYILKRKEHLYAINNPMPIDVLLLQHNPTQKPETVNKALDFKEVIADGSNTPYYIRRWRTYCAKKNIVFTYTGD